MMTLLPRPRRYRIKVICCFVHAEENRYVRQIGGPRVLVIGAAGGIGYAAATALRR